MGETGYYALPKPDHARRPRMIHVINHAIFMNGWNGRL